MIIKINGDVVERPFSLSDKWNEVVEDTEQLINSKNRQIRRSKPIRKILPLIGIVTTLGYSSVANAQTIYSPTNPAGLMQLIVDKVVIGNTTSNIKDSVGISEGINREDTVIWKMNDWFQQVLLHTTDFFDNAQVLTVFNSIWYICMSFVMIIISKKGFDMVKAKILGTSTLGLSELIVRLLASVVMTFLSLDIMQLGIEASNLTMKTLFSAIESHLIPYEALERTNSLGLVFWFIGFCLMFVVLGIQYWIRQITIVLLGVLAPVCNTAWIVDGGQMVGTAIREFITLIATPLIHGLVLGLGSVLMFEITTMTGNNFIDSMNSILIGFSTMFLMVFTPTFLRKFTTGSTNPFRWAFNLGKGTYGSAIKLARLLRK